MGILDEIREQPAALQRCLGAFPKYSARLEALAEDVRRGRYGQVIFTGMGSSYYSGYPSRIALSESGIPASLWEASELLHYAPHALSEHTLLIAVSQSGESVEVRKLAQLPNQPGLSVTVTNGLENTAARWSDLPLNTFAGTESAVSTKTYVTGLAVLHLLGAQLAGQDGEAAVRELSAVGDAMARWLAEVGSRVEEAVEFLRPHRAMVFLGRGPSLATAYTSALVTQETSKMFCLGISSAQFRHGPLEMVREGFRAVVFTGNDASSHLNIRLASEIGAYGGKSLLIHPEDLPLGVQELPGVYPLAIPSAGPALLPLLEIVPVQLMLISLARARGFDPEVFEHGAKVTLTE